MQNTAASSGKKLGSRRGKAAPADARAAAAEAALQRAGGEAGAAGSGSQPVPAQQQSAQPQFSKGQVVHYRQRDGTWTQAKVRGRLGAALQSHVCVLWAC